MQNSKSLWITIYKLCFNTQIFLSISYVMPQLDVVIKLSSIIVVKAKDPGIEPQRSCVSLSRYPLEWIVWGGTVMCLSHFALKLSHLEQKAVGVNVKHVFITDILKRAWRHLKTFGHFKEWQNQTIPYLKKENLIF